MKLWVVCLFILALAGCSQNYTPKPRGYFRIDFPVKTYQHFSSNYPYSFDFPQYGLAIKDSDRIAEPYWMNVEFPKWKCKLHLSYKPINNNVAKFIEDAHILAYKHTIKADAINELLIVKPNQKVYGLVYDIEGNAASSVQFYLTDSVKHFLRGALYFNSQPNKDSLGPAIDFFRKDILHLIETLHWN